MAIWYHLLQRTPCCHSRISPSLLQSLSVSVRWHCDAGFPPGTEALAAVSTAGGTLPREPVLNSSCAKSGGGDIKVSPRRKQSRVIGEKVVPNLHPKVEIAVKQSRAIGENVAPNVHPKVENVVKALSKRGGQTGTSHLQKIKFLVSEGFAQEQVEKVSESLPFFKVSYVNLVSVIQFLKTANICGKDAGAVLIKFPNLLSRSAELLERKTRILEEVGLQRQKLITVAPRLFSLNSENVRRKVDVFLSLGVDAKVFQRFPLVLTLSTEESLNSKLDFFRTIGIKNDDIVKLISRQPQLLSLKQETLQRRCDILKEQGLSDDDVTYIVMNQPSILCRTERLLREKINYLVNSLNRNVKQLVLFPAFLTYSLEGRVIPRFSRLAKLKNEGLLLENSSLSTVLSTSEENFMKWIQRKGNQQKSLTGRRLV